LSLGTNRRVGAGKASEAETRRKSAKNNVTIEKEHSALKKNRTQKKKANPDYNREERKRGKQREEGK
jgi:hypothetical protein